MTEPNLPPQDPPSQVPSERHQASSQGDTAGTTPPPVSQTGVDANGSDDWETLQFPDGINVEEIPQSQSARKADEMLRLIQDLNQCNDALLSRVAQLEEALECSEAALQKEVERSQQSPEPSGAEVRALRAQQQQVAQLLSELDVANDALRRTTIHNETLQTELDASQQRVAQLERECTLLQQRFGDKTSALQQAEATCRDLRSRLQRQQRYTLQFKAALEKCLNMSGRSEQGADIDLTADSLGGMSSESRPSPIAMPKNQQIQPWTASKGTVPSPSGLDTMLRGLQRADTPPNSAASAPSAEQYSDPSASKPVTDSEAESQLWQDLERVVEAPVSNDEVGAQPPMPSPQPSPGFTEPSPWGAPLAASSQTSSSAEAEFSPQAPQSSESVAHQTISSASRAQLAMPPTMKAQTVTGMSPAGSSPSPVVHPLRPAKKLKSIAAVQLPSFPQSQRRSS